MIQSEAMRCVARLVAGYPGVPIPDTSLVLFVEEFAAMSDSMLGLQVVAQLHEYVPDGRNLSVGRIKEAHRVVRGRLAPPRQLPAGPTEQEIRAFHQTIERYWEENPDHPMHPKRRGARAKAERDQVAALLNAPTGTSAVGPRISPWGPGGVPTTGHTGAAVVDGKCSVCHSPVEEGCVQVAERA